MAFQIGAKPGPGRPPGAANTHTINARAAIAEFIEGNVDRLNALLVRIEEVNGPKAAFDSLMSVMEYHIPKLNRSEVEQTHILKVFAIPPVDELEIEKWEKNNNGTLIEHQQETLLNVKKELESANPQAEKAE